MITLSVLHINQKMCEIVLSIEDNREEKYAKIIINDSNFFSETAISILDILALQMTCPGNRNCANCVRELSFLIPNWLQNYRLFVNLRSVARYYVRPAWVLGFIRVRIALLMVSCDVCLSGCLRVSELLEICWNLVDAAGKFHN